jgi:fructose-specific phosphotransferase system component IIB
MNIIKCGCKGWKNSVNEEEKRNADKMAHADDIKVWMRVRNKQVKMRSNIKKGEKKNLMQVDGKSTVEHGKNQKAIFRRGGLACEIIG